MKSTKEPITNTTRDDPLPRAIMGGRPGAIEEQETRGQRELVSTTSRLPVDFGFDREGKGRAALEAAGVKFGEVIAGDPIWRAVELPDGWKLRPTDHSMWSELVDHLERPRANIFYKAAFYDRSCRISVSARFAASCDSPKAFKDPGPFFGVVKDCNREIWRSCGVNSSDAFQRILADRRLGDRTYINSLTEEQRDKILYEGDGATRALNLATAYLDEHRPDWKRLAAYWDETPR